MPQVVNGCGTWYYGKKNLQQYQGICSHCQNVATLSSYDTRLFVVVVFIPVIPLRRKHIVEECSVCRRHGAVSLGDWQQFQHRSAQILSDYREHPTDPKRAEEAVRACVGFRDLPTFLQIAPEIEKNLSGDPKLLTMLATVFDMFGRSKDTERLLLAALYQQDEPETREAMANCLMRQGRPAEAEPFLHHIVEEGHPDRVGALYQLAQGYQLQGEHEKALAVFGQCETVNPLIVKDATFVRLRDASAKHAGTNKAINPGQVERKALLAQKRRKFLKVAPVVVLLAAAAYFALTWYQGLRCPIHLVNGLDRPYAVRLNGIERRLSPHSTAPIRLAEGDVVVELPGTTIPPETVTISRPWWSRPFLKDVFLINPDRSAVLQQLTVTYVARERMPQGAPPAANMLFVGQTMYHLTAIDFPFTPMPETIKLDSRTSETRRVSLSLIGSEAGLPGHLLLFGLRDRVAASLLLDAAQRRLLLEPSQSEYFLVLENLMPADALATFVRPKLAERPLLTAWHRTYLNAVEVLRKDAEALQEYEALLAADPTNVDLMYLVGRICHDPDRALALWSEAIKGDHPAGLAHYSLCGYYLANGDFSQAAQHGKRAVELMPEDEGARWFCEQSLLAAEQFDELQSMIAADRAAPAPQNLFAAEQEAYLLMARGKETEAKSWLDELRAQWTSVQPESATQRVDTLQAELAYMQGQTEEFVEVLGQSSDPELRLAANLTAGDLATADHNLQQSGASAFSHLLIFLAAHRASQAEVADRHLQCAIELLAEGDYSDRMFAQALQGDASTPMDKVLRLRDVPVEKAAILAALATRQEAVRAQCVALARQLNFVKRFPHRIIAEALDAIQP